MPRFTAFLAAPLAVAPLPTLADAPARCALSEVQPFLARAAGSRAYPPEVQEWLTTRAGQYIEPFKAFDNLWYVGGCWVGAWVITTSEGAILIDTLYEPLTAMLPENLAKAGIAPESVKYVVMTHGHWDHVGGAERLKPLLKNARFVMSARGWDEALGKARSRPGFAPWKMVDRDMVVKDGDVLSLGGTKLTLYETPGHSFGTISFAFDVTDGGTTYHAFTVGGLATATIESSIQARDYLASVKRVQSLVVDPARPVDVYVATHLYQSRDVTALGAALRARKPGEPHPMVDRAGFVKELERLGAAGDKKLAAEKDAGR